MRDKVIYRRENYVILLSGKSFVIYNMRKHFKEGHTHIKDFNMCKVLIDHSLNRKPPKTKNDYLLRSLERLTDDEEYYRLVRGYRNHLKRRRGKNGINK